MVDDSNTLALLQASLSCAVPLWIGRFKTYPWSQIEQDRERCLELIASHGDNILYRSKKLGDTAKAFNALAKAMAMLSFMPGGVRAFGLHFEDHHPDVTHE